MAVTVFATELFPEKGVRGIKIEFKDDTGILVVPNADTIKWSLTTVPTNRSTTPTVINSREDQAIASASTIYIPLSGDDLSILSAEVDYAQANRLLTVIWEYDSANLGNNISDYLQYRFSVENLFKVT
jgi:hypothetical protein